MYRLNLFIFTLCFICLGCKNEAKQPQEIKESVETQPAKVEKKENFLVFESSLVNEDIEDAVYNNVEFSSNGAYFNGEKQSYIKASNVNIGLNKDFNVSFWFKFIGDFGANPPALFVYKNKFSSPSRSPLYIFLPGRKVSGVFGEQMLFAENYDGQQGYSRKYHDSFQLSADTNYFLSINLEEDKLRIFINSELYMEYENIKSPELPGKELILGTYPFGGEFKNSFNGTMKGLKVFSRSLSEKEIVELYNSEPYLE